MYRISLDNIFLHATDLVSIHPIPAIAPSAESCIRKALDGARHHPGLVGLADAKSEDEAATGTAFALM
jgi:hypothetical protein